jgi:RecA/RadA recombinase
VSKNDIDHIITSTPDTIERVLKIAQNKIKLFIEKKKNDEEDVDLKKD